ncbi:hypothetical protein [Bradyrhizobium erythrophlei]|uniref:Phage protein D n=1 Tax=Bradyrhizobium erythrophlei TaxID=1437360 RepID=A0A1M5NRK7_9BRAD|nr:hypothetical protein [Bradyrhizobium erythrophlei]SHG92085.1 hypothetical protein SAMN05443248_3089 [Bradyrhizobium erythrophlei]
MAITSGAGPHSAFLNVNGQSFPIEHGSVEQQAKRKSGTFSCAIPLTYPGALEALTGLGQNTATITVTTRGMNEPLTTGEIDKTNFDLIGLVINVHGRDASAPLHSNKTSEKWQNKMGSDIVTDLATRVGLKVQADPSGLMAGKQLQQDYVRLSDNVSFSYVIHKLAEFDGARWYIDATGTLHYQSQDNPTGVYTLNYVPPGPGPMAADSLALVVKRNVQAGKSQSVSIKAWHPKQKQVFTDTYVVPGKVGQVSYNYHIPNLLQDHVSQHAKSRAIERARNEFTIEASVPGDPTVNVGMDLQLNGTGYFDSTYQMDSVTHEIGMAGHTTHITARGAAAGRIASSTSSTAPTPAEQLAAGEIAP